MSENAERSGHHPPEILWASRPTSVLRREVHGVEHEGPLVGLLVEDLAGGLTGTVAR